MKNKEKRVRWFGIFSIFILIDIWGCLAVGCGNGMENSVKKEPSSVNEKWQEIEEEASDESRSFLFLSDHSRDELHISKYIGEETVVFVPEIVNGKKVTVIGAHAFADNDNITQVILSEEIRRISHEAFRDCKNLEYIFLPEGIEIIEENAFANCIALKELYFPEGLEEIICNVCTGCVSLEGIYLPPGLVVRISRGYDNSFISCPNLKLIYGKDEYAEQYALVNNYTYVDMNRIEEEGNIVW